MLPTPTEIDRRLRRHEDAIADLFARLAEVERKADAFGREVGDRFDRVECRLSQNLADAQEQLVETVIGISTLLSRLDEELTGLDDHLAGIDAHLARLDLTYAEALRGLLEAV